MHTHRTIFAHFDIDLAVEFPDLEVPVLATAQRQGDVFWFPTESTDEGVDIPRAGFAVVRGQSSLAHDHLLHVMVGTARWHSLGEGGVQRGVLVVDEGSEVYLLHTGEHGASGIGPGTYRFHSQREYAGEWRRVAD